MTQENDNKNRSKLKELIKNSDLDEAFKERLLDFAEELQNGRLEQLLENIKEKLNDN